MGCKGFLRVVAAAAVDRWRGDDVMTAGISALAATHPRAAQCSINTLRDVSPTQPSGMSHFQRMNWTPTWKHNQRSFAFECCRRSRTYPKNTTRCSLYCRTPLTS